jgi:multiple sugar transport system ATP-binding protein
MHLQVDRVSKRFGKVSAVDDVSLVAEEGEFIVLLGPSGCGKSTLLRMVAGLEKCDSGKITLGGRDLTPLYPSERDVAMVFQNYALYPHMTVGENIAYPLKIRRKPLAEIASEVSAAAERLGLTALLNRRPRELSGGQRQRVALARALVRRPRIFLMDEPLSNLDAKLRVQMRAELKRLQRELATTTLYVTHDQAEAMTLASRIAVMDGGEIQQYGTPREIYQSPANLFVAGFIGSPAMNLLAGTLESASFQSRSLSMSLFPDLLRIAPSPDVLIGFRPEDIEISSQPREGHCVARVYVVEELGDESFLIVDMNGTRVTVRVNADSRWEADQVVWIRPNQQKLHLFDAATSRNVRLDTAGKVAFSLVSSSALGEINT